MLLLMFPCALIVGEASAEPVDIQVDAVALESGTVEFNSPGQGLPRMYVAGRTDAFFCTVGATKGQYRRAAEKLAVFLQTVASEAPSHPDAVWSKVAGVSVMGIVPVGMCALQASTMEGHIYITVTHTRACFGSAGCNYDSVAVGATSQQAMNWATRLRASAP